MSSPLGSLRVNHIVTLARRCHESRPHCRGVLGSCICIGFLLYQCQDGTSEGHSTFYHYSTIVTWNDTPLLPTHLLLERNTRLFDPRLSPLDQYSLTRDSSERIRGIVTRPSILVYSSLVRTYSLTRYSPKSYDEYSVTCCSAQPSTFTRMLVPRTFSSKTVTECSLVFPP